MSGDLTGTESELASLRRQLAEARENLRLIQERKAEYVLGTDIPLQLVKEERQLMERIAELEQLVERSEGPSEPAAGPAAITGDGNVIGDHNVVTVNKRPAGEWIIQDGQLYPTLSPEQLRSLLESAGAASPLPAASTGLPRQLRVFLCHVSGDEPAVRDLYRRLRADGIAPWLDEEDLLPGQDRQLEKLKAVLSSDVVIICLSRRAITKAGDVQKEIRDALEVAGDVHKVWYTLDAAGDVQEEIMYALGAADVRQGGAIFIPLRLEECEVPKRLSRWQPVDLFEETGYERLLRALRVRAESLGLDTHPVGPAGDRWRNPRDGKEMVRVPAGTFLYGEDKKEVELSEFWIDKAPVTNAEYARFVAETGHTPPEHWEGETPPEKIADHPVIFVSWHDATAYANWAGGRLPTEQEWEKAARGTDGREYPWGEWAEGRCNSEEARIGGTTPVGEYSPQGDSPYGCQDCAGNVCEWTASKYEPGSGYGVVRGGAWSGGQRLARCAFRGRLIPDGPNYDVGLRVVVSRAPG